MNKQKAHILRKKRDSGTATDEELALLEEYESTTRTRTRKVRDTESEMAPESPVTRNDPAVLFVTEVKNGKKRRYVKMNNVIATVFMSEALSGLYASSIELPTLLERKPWVNLATLVGEARLDEFLMHASADVVGEKDMKMRASTLALLAITANSAQTFVLKKQIERDMTASTDKCPVCERPLPDNLATRDSYMCECGAKFERGEMPSYGEDA